MTEKSTCPLCGAGTNQPVCAQCWKSYAADLQKLARLLPELELVARREEHMGGRDEGHSHPAFASTPVDLSAMDLLKEATDTLQEVGGNAGIWDRTWRSVIRKMLARRQQLVQSPRLVEGRQRVSRLVGKVALRLTPPTERLIIGSCLNPACNAELTAVQDQRESVCPQCGSVWEVEAVRQKRRDRLSGRTLEATPAEAAHWLKRETGVYVTRKVVNMWAQRGMLSAPSVGDGVHEYDIGELLRLAETFMPRDGLRHARR